MCAAVLPAVVCADSTLRAGTAIRETSVKCEAECEKSDERPCDSPDTDTDGSLSIVEFYRYCVR